MRPITLSQTGVGNSVPIPVDWRISPFELSIKVAAGGNTYSVVWTEDDVFNPAVTAEWFAGPANLTGATTDQVGTLVSPVTAIQLQVTAGAGTSAMRVVQAGN